MHDTLTISNAFYYWSFALEQETTPPLLNFLLSSHLTIYNNVSSWTQDIRFFGADWISRGMNLLDCFKVTLTTISMELRSSYTTSNHADSIISLCVISNGERYRQRSQAGW